VKKVRIPCCTPVFSDFRTFDTLQVTHEKSDPSRERTKSSPRKYTGRGGRGPDSVATEFIAVAPAQFVFKIRGQRDRTSTSFTASSSQRGLVRVTGALMTRVTHTVTRHLTSPLWKVTGNSQVASATAKTWYELADTLAQALQARRRVQRTCAQVARHLCD
jgi:hypothetical protein